MNFLWSVIFGDRPAIWNLPALLLWSVFGNHDDGPYGFYEPTKDMDCKTALKWWARNPMHNLWFYTLALPLWWSLTIYGTSNGGYMPAKRPGVLIMLNPLPYICIQTKEWTFYIGYRSQIQRANNNKPIGAFGIAFRKT